LNSFDGQIKTKMDEFLSQINQISNISRKLEYLVDSTEVIEVKLTKEKNKIEQIKEKIQEEKDKIQTYQNEIYIQQKQLHAGEITDGQYLEYANRYQLPIDNKEKWIENYGREIENRREGVAELERKLGNSRRN
jgi:chromosome segregation ATPase